MRVKLSCKLNDAEPKIIFIIYVSYPGSEFETHKMTIKDKNTFSTT